MKKIFIGLAFVLSVIYPIKAQTEMKAKKIVQTSGREQLGEFAPEFARVNDDILFGEVWSRNDLLSLRDRSIVTVVALMSQGLTDSSFKYHLLTAKNNGISKTEISEILTHAAFYAGWPKAWAAFRMAKEVWGEEPQTLAEFQASTPYPIGEPNNAFAKYFIGNSYLAPMDSKNGGPTNVTFEPGCRNNWHIHHNSTQVLTCVSGRGWYQEEGKDPVELVPGVVVAIPQGVKHWHGAAKDSWMQHLTYNANVGKDASTEWLEPVDDEQYSRLQ